MLYVLLFLLLVLLLLCLALITYQCTLNIFEPGAIYYPTTDSDVENMLKLTQLTPQDTLIDLGSGDGRILIAAAQKGAHAIGYEINPFLVFSSRRRIRQLHLDHLITIYYRSFWHADISQATVITVYLFPHLMDRLHRFLSTTPHAPLRVVSNNYLFSTQKPTTTQGNLHLYTF